MSAAGNTWLHFYMDRDKTFKTFKSRWETSDDVDVMELLVTAACRTLNRKVVVLCDLTKVVDGRVVTVQMNGCRKSLSFPLLSCHLDLEVRHPISPVLSSAPPPQPPTTVSSRSSLSLPLTPPFLPLLGVQAFGAAHSDTAGAAPSQTKKYTHTQ